MKDALGGLVTILGSIVLLSFVVGFFKGLFG